MASNGNGFDLGAFDAADEVDLVIKHPHTGEPTNWIVKVAGPAHPKTIEMSNRLQRARLREEREKEQARVNFRKWKGEETTPEENVLKFTADLAERIVGWSYVELDGAPFPYSQENALKLLRDRRKPWFLDQFSAFLRDDENFILRSSETSAHSPSGNSGSPQENRTV